MNKNIHKEILKVCRKAWVTFGKVTSVLQPHQYFQHTSSVTLIKILCSEYVRQGRIRRLQPASHQGAVRGDGPVRNQLRQGGGHNAGFHLVRHLRMRTEST